MDNQIVMVTKFKPKGEYMKAEMQKVGVENVHLFDNLVTAFNTVVGVVEAFFIDWDTAADLEDLIKKMPNRFPGAHLILVVFNEEVTEQQEDDAIMFGFTEVVTEDEVSTIVDNLEPLELH